VTLIWHIFRKDLRHAWMYAAIGFALLLVSAWNFSRLLAADRRGQFSLYSIQVPADALLLVAWGLLSGVLVLAERIPGVRQHWLARPVRWQDLLCAKALLLVLVAALPLISVHLSLVASRGFSLAEYALAVSWNALLMVLVCTLAIAVFASVSRNVQDLVLWTMVVGGAVFVSLALVFTGPRAYPDETRWVVNSAIVLVGVIGGIGILVWQYATRRTWPGRIAVVALCALLVSMDFWPASFWYAVRRAQSAQQVSGQIGVLSVYPENVRWTPNWLPGNRVGMGDKVGLALRVDGVPENWLIESNGWSNIELRTSSGDAPSINANDVHGSIKGKTFDVMFTFPYEFAERHRTDSLDITMTGEFAVYGPPETHSMKVDSEEFVPGLGRCRSAARTELLVDCQAVLQPAVRVVGFWGKATIFGCREDHAPLSRMPISFLGGGISATSSFDSKDIVFEVRKPLAYVQRRVEVRGLRWESVNR